MHSSKGCCHQGVHKTNQFLISPRTPCRNIYPSKRHKRHQGYGCGKASWLLSAHCGNAIPSGGKAYHRRFHNRLSHEGGLSSPAYIRCHHIRNSKGMRSQDVRTPLTSLQAPLRSIHHRLPQPKPHSIILIRPIPAPTVSHRPEHGQQTDSLMCSKRTYTGRWTTAPHIHGQNTD